MFVGIATGLLLVIRWLAWCGLWFSRPPTGVQRTAHIVRHPSFCDDFVSPDSPYREVPAHTAITIYSVEATTRCPPPARRATDRCDVLFWSTRQDKAQRIPTRRASNRSTSDNGTAGTTSKQESSPRIHRHHELDKSGCCK